MNGPEQLWMVWLVAFLTLGIYSYLYSDNRLYRILLNIMIGLGVGYGFVIAWKQTISPKWWEPAWGDFVVPQTSNGGVFHWIAALFSYVGTHLWPVSYWLILGILGAFWYLQLTRKYTWLSRIVIGLSIGSGAGVVFKSSFLMNAPQITDSFRPLVARQPSALWPNGAPLIGTVGRIDFWPALWQSVNNIIFVGAIICVMVYFFFSFSHDRKSIATTAKIGRWVLMISFGAFFGNTVMTRMAVFLERLKYLIQTWAPAPMPLFDSRIVSCLYALALVVLFVVGIWLLKPRKPYKKPEMVGEEFPGAPTGGEV